jgi:hypothetical protein
MRKMSLILLTLGIGLGVSGCQSYDDSEQTLVDAYHAAEAGKLDRFQTLLTADALSQYGDEAGMQKFTESFSIQKDSKLTEQLISTQATSETVTTTETRVTLLNDQGSPAHSVIVTCINKNPPECVPRPHSTCLPNPADESSCAISSVEF